MPRAEPPPPRAGAWHGRRSATDTSQVQSHFRVQVSDYAHLMARLIPYYAEQREIVLRLVPFEPDARLNVLDLGCGPGPLAARILEAYPAARLTAFDLTEEMVEACRRTLAGSSGVTYVAGDFRTDPLGGDYDLIVASLSLHHLRLVERPAFYARALESLRPGGMLIAAEVVVDEDTAVRARQYELWRSFMAENGEDAAAWYDKHLAKDHPATLPGMLDLMRAAGFEEAGCAWRYLNFAVVSARSPGTWKPSE